MNTEKLTHSYQIVQNANGSTTECYASSLDLGGEDKFGERLYSDGFWKTKMNEVEKFGGGQAKKRKIQM